MSKEQTFEPGDLAICIAKVRPGSKHPIRSGGIYSVLQVTRCCEAQLVLDGVPAGIASQCPKCKHVFITPAFTAKSFRKLTPPAKDRAELRDEQLELAK